MSCYTNFRKSDKLLQLLKVSAFRVTNFVKSSSLVEPHTFMIALCELFNHPHQFINCCWVHTGRHGSLGCPKKRNLRGWHLDCREDWCLVKNRSATNFSRINSQFMCMSWHVAASCKRIIGFWLQLISPRALPFLQEDPRDKLVL